MKNKEITKILNEIANLLEIKGVPFKPAAYRKAASAIEKLNKPNLEEIKKTKGVGKSISEKIEEFTRTGKINYYEKLKEETAIRQIIAHYFKTKGISLEKLKKNARKKEIIYSRFTKPAKQLLELSGSIEKAKKAITKVADWANSRNLDYAIETVFKKWLELDKLKPKEIVKKPFYRENPMVWSETKKKWYVITEESNWLEFAGKESEIEWKTIKKLDIKKEQVSRKKE